MPMTEPSGPDPGRVAGVGGPFSGRPASGREAGPGRWLPGLGVLRTYDPAWLGHDVVAGLVLTTMLVPVGIAYAEASGVPGIHGLYATIVPLLAYALFGPSRILVLGPDSALAAVLRPEPPPRSGTRFRARRGDPRDRPAAVRRRSLEGGRPGRRNGPGVGRRLHRGRHSASRFHHRAPLEADSLRLHERDRADRVAEPDAEAPRVLDRHAGAAARHLVDRESGARRPDERRGAPDR